MASPSSSSSEMPSETRTIDGLEVTVYQLPVMKSLDLANALIRIVGPALAGLAGLWPSKSAGGVGEGLAKINAGALAPVVDQLFARLTVDEQRSLIGQLLAPVSVIVEREGKKKRYDLANGGDIDFAFLGKRMSLFKVLRFSLEVNFSDFLDFVSTFLIRLKEESPSSSPTISEIHGSSGDLSRRDN